MSSRNVVRAFLAVTVLLSAVVLLGGSGGQHAVPDNSPGNVVAASGEPVAPPRENVTVVATDSNAWLADEGDGPRAHAELLAFGPNGSIVYYNDTYDRYWDVDPTPPGRMTVQYVASMHLTKAECNATTVCTRNVVERVNLTTGEVTRLYGRITPFKHSTRWHDADRLGEHRIVVADIYEDRVFAVNTTTDIVTWAWDAQSEYEPGSGGPYPRDWTHLNDVEVLDDGRIMVSLRNQDQVVFLDPETGLLEEWTLGEDDDHETLYEQHNPDYIPESRGGPAVLVADSENNRVVEYQRTDGTWTQSWNWSDSQTLWPRDADRLPNGNTLITDSNGNRVLEVDESGDVVWSVNVSFPYEAERIGTGDESSGGHSAAELDLESGPGAASDERGSASTRTGILDRVWHAVKGWIPGSLLNGIVYLLPVGFGPRKVAALLALVACVPAWAALEWRWSRFAVDLRWPVRLGRR